jgi:NtrC-family two-component system sensor histidine kinase KinB
VLPFGAAGEKRGAVVVLYEVTELAKLDEMRVDFLAAASHELRTPLTTLRMTLPLLEEAGPLTDRQHEMLSTASSGCDQLAATIDGFLDLSQIEDGRLRLSREVIGVDELVGEVVDRFEPRFTASEITLTVNDRANGAAVFGDASRLRAVVSNVLANALKYTPSGGNVNVELSLLDSDQVRIAIEDSGRGVPSELQGRVFEKYFRVEHERPGMERRARGAGLGLYLCRQLVTAHGGTISCTPGKRGPGARFEIDLGAVRLAA